MPYEYNMYTTEKKQRIFKIPDNITVFFFHIIMAFFNKNNSNANCCIQCDVSYT